VQNLGVCPPQGPRGGGEVWGCLVFFWGGGGGGCFIVLDTQLF